MQSQCSMKQNSNVSKPNKASGPDNLSPRVHKEYASIIAPLLRTLYQKLLDTLAVPIDWKQSTVSPVFKKGGRYQPANYRPISLMCICSKIMEHIITSNMKRYFESNHLLIANTDSEPREAVRHNWLS